MEKFAVDLDKVLDDFEFNEDCVEQINSSLISKHSSNNATCSQNIQHYPTLPPYRRPPFEPIHLADADFSVEESTITAPTPPKIESTDPISPSRFQDIRIHNDTGISYPWQPKIHNNEVNGVYSNINTYIKKDDELNSYIEKEELQEETENVKLIDNIPDLLESDPGPTESSGDGNGSSGGGDDSDNSNENPKLPDVATLVVPEESPPPVTVKENPPAPPSPPPAPSSVVVFQPINNEMTEAEVEKYLEEFEKEENNANINEHIDEEKEDEEDTNNNNNNNNNNAEKEQQQQQLDQEKEPPMEQPKPIISIECQENNNNNNNNNSIPPAVVQVKTCLIQTPRDGKKINVLGEEERPTRPRFLFLPSRVQLPEDETTTTTVSTITTTTATTTTTTSTNNNMNENEAAAVQQPPVENGNDEELISPSSSENSSILAEQAISVDPTPTESFSSAQMVTPTMVTPVSGTIDDGMASTPLSWQTTPVDPAVSSLSSLPSCTLSPVERSLGKFPPIWVLDSDAPSCMQCEGKFTVFRRRHHCRGCGKVLCSKCCNLKSKLEYMENAEARVCQPCYDTLQKVMQVEEQESAAALSSNSSGVLPGSPGSETSSGSTGELEPIDSAVDNGNLNNGMVRRPNPNHPMEYCSTVPPLEQAAPFLSQPPPSVMVPIGVLKRQGVARGRSEVAKQVMFSDGIRPGGDLTELDGSAESRQPLRRPGRTARRVGTPPGETTKPPTCPALDPNTQSYLPAEKGLPPLATLCRGELRLEESPEGDLGDRLLTSLRSDTDPPLMFALNKNLFVNVKILNLSCCVNRVCWCLSTDGLARVGQDEVVIVLECLEDERTIPRDLFTFLISLYKEASRGATIRELGFLGGCGPFLSSNDHAGFLFIRPSFQCLQKLIVPAAPFLVGILIHRWETPWARIFPIRLMLRLGAEFRYYPCSLVSVRHRPSVFFEIGHTIMNVLADFRNLSYTLPSVRGLIIHMEDRQTSILLPRNRYDQVCRALNDSNEHVLAFGANFSPDADSHLVCVQSSDDGTYGTQAINIHNRPRKVTGASYVVFNGALKSSLNLSAKSSIVEDGLMVQINGDSMQALRQALRNMTDFHIGCGPLSAAQPDEMVNVLWVDDDTNFNLGVLSVIDRKPLDGIASIRVHNGTDYLGNNRLIRWTEVFILQSDDDNGGTRGDPLDISRLSEALAKATCLALVKHLEALSQAGLIKIAVRANIHAEDVGYEAGAGGERLPAEYMNALDNELIPVLHNAATSTDNPAAILELIFHVMYQ